MTNTYNDARAVRTAIGGTASWRGDLWVFGYGSLMWRPGFDVVETQAALLRGWHRRFCTRSTLHRGTPRRPGLVLGLDRGGSCRGLALRVTARNRRRVIAYLMERELVYPLYEPRKVRLETAAGRIDALAFVVDRHGRGYAGPIGPDNAARIIASATGQGGTNRDYLAMTAAGLADMGFADPKLEDLLVRVDQEIAASA